MWQVEAISNLHATLNIKTTAKAKNIPYKHTESQLLRIFGRNRAASTVKENKNRKFIGPTVSVFTKSQRILLNTTSKKRCLDSSAVNETVLPKISQNGCIKAGA